jgi:hypothetical protein
MLELTPKGSVAGVAAAVDAVIDARGEKFLVRFFSRMPLQRETHSRADAAQVAFAAKVLMLRLNGLQPQPRVMLRVGRLLELTGKIVEFQARARVLAFHETTAQQAQGS